MSDKTRDESIAGDSINAKAKRARGEEDTQVVRELADEIFNSPYFAEMPDDFRQAAKERAIREEMAYRQGRSGVKAEQLVSTVNGLADKFQLPDYARTSPLQLVVLRARLKLGYPDFVAQEKDSQNEGLKKKVGTPLNAEMSPLEAVFTMAVLLQQKMLNKDFQSAPADYARNLHQKEVEKWQSARAGRLINKSQEEEQPLGFGDASKYRELREAIAQRVVKMTMPELIALPDETLNKLFNSKGESR